jgi:hypothetical protein
MWDMEMAAPTMTYGLCSYSSDLQLRGARKGTDF